ncbi:MAG: hypothetical protein NVSMB27_25080 [Ktedonobacteraceae bacterium]
MQTQQQVWNFFQQSATSSRLIKVSVTVMLALLFLGVSLGANVPGTHAQVSTRGTVGSSSVYSANHAQASSQYSKIGLSEFLPSTYLGNQFPWPSCTWWANERYHQLHGIYVPWTTNSNAYQWTARAYDFHWHVSNTPYVGWIMDLQPWIQGAYGYGHVGVVEKYLGNGYFVASNMNWGAYPTQVTYVTFHAGYGVTFIHQ